MFLLREGVFIKHYIDDTLFFAYPNVCCRMEITQKSRTILSCSGSGKNGPGLVAASSDAVVRQCGTGCRDVSDRSGMLIATPCHGHSRKSVLPECGKDGIGGLLHGFG